MIRPTILNPQTREEINEILKTHKIYVDNYTIGAQGEINVDGDVGIPKLQSGMLPIQFGIVKRNFKCVGSNLKTLIGSPWMVKGNFWASYNELEDLQGGPIVVGREYSIGSATKSLIGSPDKVFGVFDFSGNEIESFKGFPKDVFSILALNLSVKEINIEDLPLNSDKLYLVLNDLSKEIEKDFEGVIEGNTISIEKNYEKNILNLRLRKKLTEKPNSQRKKI